jgi:hypothetical protein
MVVPVPSATLDFFYRTKEGAFDRVKAHIPTADGQDRKKVGIPHLVTRHVQVSHATLDAKKWDDYVVITNEYCEGEKVYTTSCNRFYKYLLFYLTSPDKRDSKDLNALFKNGDHKDKVYAEQRDVQRDDDARTRQLQTFMIDINLNLDSSMDVKQIKEDLANYGNIFSQVKVPIQLQGASKDDIPLCEMGSEAKCLASAVAALGRLKEGVQTLKSNIKNAELDHVVQYPENINLPYIVQIGRSVELGSRIIRVHEMKDKNEIHITLMGRVVPKYLIPGSLSYTSKRSKKSTAERAFSKLVQNGIELPDFNIEIPGAKPIAVKKTKIQPGYSTFIDLDLEKN